MVKVLSESLNRLIFNVLYGNVESNSPVEESLLRTL